MSSYIQDPKYYLLYLWARPPVVPFFVWSVVFFNGRSGWVFLPPVVHLLWSGSQTFFWLWTNIYICFQASCSCTLWVILVRISYLQCDTGSESFCFLPYLDLLTHLQIPLLTTAPQKRTTFFIAFWDGAKLFWSLSCPRQGFNIPSFDKELYPKLPSLHRGKFTYPVPYVNINILLSS